MSLNAIYNTVIEAAKNIGAVVGTPSQLEEALEALQAGDTEKATALFEKETERTELAAKEGAEAYRNLGALAYLDDTQKSLNAYRRATQLDPENGDGWNQLGHLLRRTGELDEAINAYQTVLLLGQEHEDQEEIAVAYGNLGIVYDSRGDLDEAVEYYHKALEISESLGDKEKAAAIYGNLGIVYDSRGDLDKALEFYHKALEIDESLGRKEGMALNYQNIGIIYEIREDYEKAREDWEKSLVLFQALGSPNAKKMQDWLDGLPR